MSLVSKYACSIGRSIGKERKQSGLQTFAVIQGCIKVKDVADTVTPQLQAISAKAETICTQELYTSVSGSNFACCVPVVVRKQKSGLQLQF